MKKSTFTKLAIAVLATVFYLWSSKREQFSQKHMFNSKVVLTVPLELKQKNIIEGSCFTCKFKRSGMSKDLPASMNSVAYDKNIGFVGKFMGNHEHDDLKKVVNDVNHLKNENTLNHILSRVINLNDVCSSIAEKYRNRDFNVFEFPFTDY